MTQELNASKLSWIPSSTLGVVEMPPLLPLSIWHATEEWLDRSLDSLSYSNLNTRYPKNE
jgi:hypothetical protein